MCLGLTSLKKGKKIVTFILYAFHNAWKSKQDFINLTKSDAFRKAHGGAGRHNEIYLGHLEFEDQCNSTTHK